MIKISKHLIKRKGIEKYNDIKDGWYCEVKVKTKPSGSKVKSDDIIYIAKNGYGIFAKGIVDLVKNIECQNFHSFVHYALNISNVDDDPYWLTKIKEYSKNPAESKYHILEYCLRETQQFDTVFPLEKRFLNQAAWYYLEDDFELKFSEVKSELTTHIPTRVREEIYHKYKIKSKEHLIDIDHLVPASLGGVGNLIENLVPISASINRRKLNRVPSKLFSLGRKFGVKVPTYIEVKHNVFYGSPKELSIAYEIIKNINNQDIEEVKKDYLSIRNFHFPSLTE